MELIGLGPTLMPSAQDTHSLPSRVSPLNVPAAVQNLTHGTQATVQPNVMLELTTLGVLSPD